MTIILDRFIAQWVHSQAYTTGSTAIGAIVVGLVLILIIERTVVEAYHGQQRNERLFALNTALIPLFVGLLFILGVHFAQLMHWV